MNTPEALALGGAMVRWMSELYPELVELAGLIGPWPNVHTDIHAAVGIDDPAGLVLAVEAVDVSGALLDVVYSAEEALLAPSAPDEASIVEPTFELGAFAIALCRIVKVPTFEVVIAPQRDAPRDERATALANRILTTARAAVDSVFGEAS